MQVAFPVQHLERVIVAIASQAFDLLSILEMMVMASLPAM